MKLVFDFFPIFVFFVVFKLSNVYAATGAFLLASCLQMAIYWYLHRRFEQMHIITFILGLVLGGATLLWHNEIFIKWKPTAIYWAFATVFLGSQFFGSKTLIQSLMESNIMLPHSIWQRLNLSWCVFFVLMGTLNLYVVYHFNTNTWVNFKLFGLLGLTLLFIIIQAFYLSRHIKPEETSDDQR
jgi:intracellular septation protein